MGSGRRIPRAAGAASVLVLAVALGVLVALLVRPGGPVVGPAARPQEDGTASPERSDDPEPVPPGQLGEVSRRVGSGAHRVVATTCSGSGIGTAYQFGTEGLLVTSVRTVSGAQSIAVAHGDRWVPAAVAKVDTRAGLALLKPATPLNGHTFALGTRPLAIGDEVAAIGWTAQAPQPARGRMRITVGTISETDVTVSSPDGKHTVARLTGEFDSGLAGAPVVGADGVLLGMLVQGAPDQGEMYVAGVDTIADPLLGPAGMAPVTEPCPSPAGPQVATPVGGPAATTTGTGLGTWYSGLNSGDWSRAHGVLSRELQGEWPPGRLASEYAGTYHFSLVAATTGSTVTVIWVRLGPGKSCARGATEFTLDRGRITGMEVNAAPDPCS